MDLAEAFCKHLKDKGYQGNLDSEEFVQVMQGVAKPIFQFLVNNWKTQEEAEFIRGNLLVHSNSSTETPEVNTSSHEQLLQEISSNQLEIDKLQKQLKIKKLRKALINAYSQKVTKVTDKLEDYTLQQERQESSFPSQDSLNQVSERLAYLMSRSKSSLSSPNIKGILDSLGVSLQNKPLFDYLTKETQNAHKEVKKLTENFKPQEQMTKFGMEIVKKENTYQVKTLDTDRVIDKLSQSIEKKREEHWKAFLKVENLIEQTETTRNKFKTLYERKKTKSKKNQNIEKLHELELKVATLKAQNSELKANIECINQLKKDYKQKLLILKNQHLKLDQPSQEKQKLSEKVHEVMTQNTNLRRNLTKYKLRIEKFMQEHIVSLRTNLPDLLKPLFTCVIKETQEFLQASDFLKPLNVPSPSLPEATVSSVPSPTSPHLFKVYKAAGLPVYFTPEFLKFILEKLVTEEPEEFFVEGKQEKQPRKTTAIDRLNQINEALDYEESKLAEIQDKETNSWKFSSFMYKNEFS